MSYFWEIANYVWYSGWYCHVGTNAKSWIYQEDAAQVHHHHQHHHHHHSHEDDGTKLNGMICVIYFHRRGLFPKVGTMSKWNVLLRSYPKFMNTFWVWSGHLKLLFDNSNRFRNGPDADKWFYGEVNLIKKYPVWYKSVKPIFHHIFWTQSFEICYLLVLIWSVSDAFFKHEAHFLCKLVISRFFFAICYLLLLFGVIFCNLLFVAVIWSDLERSSLQGLSICLQSTDINVDWQIAQI